MLKILSFLYQLCLSFLQLDQSKKTVYSIPEIQNSMLLYLNKAHMYNEIYKRYKHMFPNSKDFKIFIGDMLKSNKIVCLNPECKLKKRKYKKYIIPFMSMCAVIPHTY